MADFYLPDGLPKPAPMNDNLDAPYWEGTAAHKLIIQKCSSCGKHQWGPEWICNHCNSFDLEWTEVAPKGRIYSYERVWHPVHPALKDHGPYIVVLVELPGADNVRMVGNLLGDPTADVPVGAEVEAVFEDHPGEELSYTLVQWQLA